MKTPIALLTLALLTSAPAFAKAKIAQACAFGETTADLADLLDSKASPRTFYKGEEINLANPLRLQGLSANEKKMIVRAIGQAAAGDEDHSEAELLQEFSSADGYITYFSHGTNGREFAQVASFPGDNEFGLIFEIKSLRGKAEFKILGVAAVIADSDLADCRVEKE